MGESSYDEWVLLNDKHAWAFYYFCKRKGDWVRVINEGSQVRIRIYYYAYEA